MTTCLQVIAHSSGINFLRKNYNTVKHFLVIQLVKIVARVGWSLKIVTFSIKNEFYRADGGK